MDLLQKILDEISNFKKQIIIVVILIVAFFALKTAVPILQEMRANQTPIVSISAENSKTYSVGTELKAADFVVKAKHEDGKTSTVDPSAIALSRTSLPKVGGISKITITLADNEEISCECDVSIKRDKVLGFQVGYPNRKDVVAVLYSNGELCFEGEGDVMIFEDNNYPWTDYEEKDDYPITAVSFEDGVQPTNMDYWFADNQLLEYVSPIPSSVKSMVGTCNGCIALKKTADWTECTNLLNINYAYSGCSALTSTFPVPSAVRTARSAFYDCTALEVAPDMSNAIDLKSAISMFENCLSMHTISLPPAVEYLDSVCKDCINLKDMPTIPDTAKSMNKSFSGCTSLLNLTHIPASVEDIGSCFSDCFYIEGEMSIDCNAESFGSVFDGAAASTSFNLTGKSKLLDAYANTSGDGNITVNGKAANPNITNYSDAMTAETTDATAELTTAETAE